MLQLLLKQYIIAINSKAAPALRSAIIYAMNIIGFNNFITNIFRKYSNFMKTLLMSQMVYASAHLHKNLPFPT